MKTLILALGLIALTARGEASYEDNVNASRGIYRKDVCYDSSAFLFRIVGRVSTNTYEIAGPEGHAILVTKDKISGPTWIKRFLRFSEMRQITANNGFEFDVPVFKDCPRDMIPARGLGGEYRRQE